MKKGKFKIDLKFSDIPDIEEYEIFYIQEKNTHPSVRFYDCDTRIRSKKFFRFLKKGGGRHYMFEINGDINDTSKSVDDWQVLIRKKLYGYRHSKKRKLEIVKGEVFNKKSTADIRNEKLEKLIK
jgi:hypothetical protein